MRRPAPATSLDDSRCDGRARQNLRVLTADFHWRVFGEADASKQRSRTRAGVARSGRIAAARSLAGGKKTRTACRSQCL